MAFRTKKEVSGQVRPATIAYVNDVRKAPGVNYAFELKVNDRPVSVIDSYYEGIERKYRRDENGEILRFTAPHADISDLNILCVMGNAGIEVEDGYLEFPLYESRDGKLVLDREKRGIKEYPQIKEAFRRAKEAFVKSERYKA